MSKKKMVASEFNTVNTENGVPVNDAVQTDAPVLDAIENMTGGTVDLRQSVKEKLEQFEKMEKTVISLSKENDALKSKIAEYIEELNQIKSSGVREVVKEVPCNNSARYQEQIKELSEENDKYLMRISELTFENAKLTAEKDNLAKSIKYNAQQTQRAQPQPRRGMNITAENGYSSWN